MQGAMQDAMIVAGAGLLGGAMNAIAGGGSFVTLPALVAAGVPSLFANATSTVALVPSALATAFAYRHDSRGFNDVKLSKMAAISVVGGAIGAVLLLKTSQKFFDNIFPFLLLFGVLVFAFGRKLGEELRKRINIHPHALPATQFVLGIYGGYFGGAVGVMMLAATVNTPLGYVLLIVAAAFAAMNVVGAYVVTDRMLQMFRPRPVAVRAASEQSAGTS